MIGRRAFVRLLGGAAAGWPVATRAQQTSASLRIGYLSFSSASQHAPRINAFRARLLDLGYIEGKNLQIEFRFADDENDLLIGMAAELANLNVDVIVTYATGVPAARRATATIPIVMVAYSDPIATGIVASLARPGGNITGSTFFHPELMAKRLELLKEVAPTISRAGVLLFKGSEANGPILSVMGDAATTLRVSLEPMEVGRSTDFENAFLAALKQQVGALIVGDHAFFLANANVVAAFATRHRLPSIGALNLTENGGLMSYGVDFSDHFRRAADFVDKIAKGGKPGDIPVEQATRFTTIVNIKTAKALGVELPTSILLRADEVIE